MKAYDETLRQLLEQLGLTLHDIQTAAVKAHLLALCNGNEPCSRQTFDALADEFCLLTIQLDVGIRELHNIIGSLEVEKEAL
ncbi:hypothetical protein FY034_02265 [Trichlorobacter lovleyi]|uniref:hypothetical protein n=1 Tax=Trichlorobacter lovleyi TaxID=313985 RepID=UPI002240DA9E|nr:hypothetical protein [Trichlorobacter lovleyi]QOX77811.1 hypothetical protein FY034_02265 [Trichlorobacter lovleyi]